MIVEPGDFRVRESIQQAADAQRVELEVRGDRHFYCSIEEFEEYASTRKGLVLEFFYRYLRKKHDVLMEDGEPIGGQWNFDHDNRESFKKTGPPASVGPKAFKLDATTKSVIELVEKRFADHPGTLDHFNLPTTRRQALAMLKQFVEYGLECFGTFQDAMWEEEHFLFHSRLSAVLNVKLLNPRECVDAAIEAHRQKKAPLNSVEGFVRQIIGWREYVRGIYWLKMPEYIDRNHLEHQQELPSFFWDGDTDLNCVQKSMRNVIDNGYAHHIQRLMVLGNFSQLWGVDPRKFHDWHMAMYLDAIDWVSLPNTVG